MGGCGKHEKKFEHVDAFDLRHITTNYAKRYMGIISAQYIIIIIIFIKLPLMALLLIILLVSLLQFVYFVKDSLVIYRKKLYSSIILCCLRRFIKNPLII